MHLVDVIALARISDELCGDYRAVATVPNGDPIPYTSAHGYVWIKIARNVSPDEAYHIMAQYPQASRAK